MNLEEAYDIIDELEEEEYVSSISRRGAVDFLKQYEKRSDLVPEISSLFFVSPLLTGDLLFRFDWLEGKSEKFLLEIIFMGDNTKSYRFLRNGKEILKILNA